jgi:hypothetical protein
MIIRENLIYYFTFLFGYGLFGAGVVKNHDYEIIYLLAPLFFFALLFFLNKENEIIFRLNKESFTSINLTQYIYLILIFLFLFYLAKERIFLSITDDEYAYTEFGLIHSNFMVSYLSSFEILGEIGIKRIYHFFSLVILIFVILYLYLLNLIFKNKRYYQLVVILFTVFIIRYVIFNIGGNQFPHPPLIALPPLLSTAFFGLSDFSIKFIPFLIYNLFAYYYFFNLKKKIKSIISFLIVLALFGIPGILYISASIEQSLFSMICFSIVGIELITNSRPDYKKLIIIILLFSLFRVLSILALSLIAFYIIFNSNSLEKFFENSKQVIKKTYPLLLILPFIFYSFTHSNDLTVSRVNLDSISVEFITNILPLTIINNFTFFPGILLFIFLIGLILFWKKNIISIFFLIICILVYGNVIDQDNKYSYEIFFPIILIFLLVYFSFEKKELSKNLISILVLIIGLSNIFIIKKFNSFCLIDKKPFKENHNYEVKFGCNIIYSKPFNLINSFNFLKGHNQFSFKNLYVPGVYYGILPSVVNGMKMKDLEIHKDINQNQNKLNLENNISWISADAKLITNDVRIKYVLIADMTNSSKLEDDLIDLGWKKIFNEVEKSFLTKISVLTKVE